MTEPKSRSLIPQEQACLTLLKNFETALRERKFTMTLTASRAAAEVISTFDGRMFNTLKVEYRPATEDYGVTFALPEFRRYIEFILPRCGLMLRIDGSMLTADNLVISNDYLGTEMENRK